MTGNPRRTSLSHLSNGIDDGPTVAPFRNGAAVAVQSGNYVIVIDFTSPETVAKNVGLRTNRPEAGANGSDRISDERSLQLKQSSSIT